MPAYRPIQPLAPGLLSLLGLKNLGRLPDGFADEVRPSLDLERWYLNGSSIILSTAEDWTADVGAGEITGFFRIGATPITGFGDITVPDGELWWVEDIDVGVSITAPSDPLTLATLELANASSAARLPPGGFAAGGIGAPHIVHAPHLAYSGYNPTVSPMVNPVEIHLDKVGQFFAPAGTQFGLVAGSIAAYDAVPAPLRLNVTLSVRFTPLKA